MLRASLLSLGLLVLSPFVAPEASAQTAGFEVRVAGAQEVSLAVPRTHGGSSQDADEVWRVLKRDLDMTGYFALTDPAAFIDRAGGMRPGDFNYEDWSVLGSSALVKTRLLAKGDPACGDASKLCGEVYVHDVFGGRLLSARRFRVDAGRGTALGHALASAALQALVGQEGFFEGVLVASRASKSGKEITLVGLDGRGMRAVTRNGSINLSPAFSPDGHKVAFTSYRRGNPDLYVKDLRTGEVRVVSNQPGVNISPAWSPDGSKLALARSHGGDSDIWIVDASTGKVIRRITTGGGIDVSPTWSPDGRKLAFSSERSGNSHIFVVDVNGGTPQRVTRFAGFFTDPVFSPDGERLAFVSRTGSYDILTVRVDGSGMVRVTQDQGHNEDPTWSPDGQYLVFSSNRGGASNLWISTANGQHQVPITSGGGWYQPDWRAR